MSAGLRLRIVGAVMLRPWLWVPAVRVLLSHAPRRWWTSFPYLPMPAESYLEFRLATQYGSDVTAARVADVLEYLRWTSQWNKHR